MTIDTSAGALVNAASGLLVAVFGVFVATRRPRRRANVAFGAFSLVLGLWLVPNNVVTPFQNSVWQQAWFLTLYFAMVLTWAAAMVAFGLLAPRSLRRGERHLAMAPGVAAGAYVVTGLVATLAALPRLLDALVAFGIPADELDSWTASVAVAISVNWLGFGAVFFVLLMLGLRFPRATDTVEKQQIRLYSTALTLWPAAAAGVFLMDNPWITPAGRGAGLVMVLLVSGLWLRHSLVLPRGPEARAARNLALLGPVVALVAYLGTMVWASLTQPLVPINSSPAHGVARTLSVAILGYGLVRRQLFGLDVKVKWTLKQSTVAAIFVAVFFVVSEGAAAVFQDQTNNTWLGILAAGGLVFAMAPLQRFAERLTDKAMPGVKPLEQMDGDERRRAYVAAAREAWSDGVLTADERALLDRMASLFGLTDEEAHRLERPVPPSM